MLSKNTKYIKIIYYSLAIILLLSFIILNNSILFPENYSLPADRLLKTSKTNILLFNCLIFIFLLLFMSYKKIIVWKTKILFTLFFLISFIDLTGLYPLSATLKSFWTKYLSFNISKFKPPIFYRIENFYNSLIISTWDWGKYISLAAPWLILIGMILIFIGWIQVYNSEKFSTNGLFKIMRHPQYTGIFLILTGWLLWKTTLVLIIFYPFVLLSYFYLARREELRLKVNYGMKYWEYFDNTPMFFPPKSSSQKNIK